MQKYISQSVYADNLKECIYGFLEDSRNITMSQAKESFGILSALCTLRTMLFQETASFGGR